MTRLVLGLILAGAASGARPADARTLRASSLKELQSRLAAAKAGDHVVLANGAYSTTQPIGVRGRHGTERAPIVVELSLIHI